VPPPPRSLIDQGKFDSPMLSKGADISSRDNIRNRGPGGGGGGGPGGGPGGPGGGHEPGGHGGGYGGNGGNGGQGGNGENGGNGGYGGGGRRLFLDDADDEERDSDNEERREVDIDPQGDASQFAGIEDEADDAEDAEEENMFDAGGNEAKKNALSLWKDLLEADDESENDEADEEETRPHRRARVRPRCE
jgi:hypothetical protein